MAQFKLTRETRTNLAVIEVIGDLQHGEIPEFLQSLQVENPAARAVLDFRGANLAGLLKHRIKTDIHKIKQFSRPELKAALVFSNPDDYSIGKIISKSLSSEGYLADIRGFYNFYLAKDWLLFCGTSD